MSEWLSVIFTEQGDLSHLMVLVACFTLIFIAELGDKSQFMCIALASRFKPSEVFVGASLGFACLNLIAVIFGHTLSTFIPDIVLAVLVCVLFVFFGFHCLLAGPEEDHQFEKKTLGKAIISSFLLIVLAELGDKTQLSVIALSSNQMPVLVFIASTLALIASTAIAVVFGVKLIKRVPKKLFDQMSAGLFFIFAAISAYKAIVLF
ncbi:TMEM165/GDT1 family protein [Catenovulum sp. SM1970]|uniref:TMEM165/GDT1 family protein n=1 Tax=Marinifaba aquimaris TaxID=2741323 RepID=UPI001573828B|nr:TMEM165/GDT1 family protein [Marinifaba aquimaris]NTS77359.1 TMEM165/GDT1 family protein [Marinifaba aquimaris]